MPERMKIATILKDQTITNQFDFSGSCKDKDGETVTFEIFTTAFFLSEVLHNYFNRETFIIDPDNAFTEFVGIFNNWKTTRGLLYARIAYAYSLGYNPIENYSSTEIMDRTDELTHGLSTERTYDNDKIERTYTNDKIERTYTNDKIERTYTNDNIVTSHSNDQVQTTYNSIQDVNAKTRYGVNSSSAVPTETDTNTRTGSDTVVYSGSKTDSHNGKYDDTHTGGYDDTHSGKYDDTHTGGYTDANTGTDSTDIDYTLTKRGNIGVMTASQMIQSEYDGLIQDLQNRALKEFLDRYTFYSEGVDLW